MQLFHGFPVKGSVDPFGGDEVVFLGFRRSISTWGESGHFQIDPHLPIQRRKAQPFGNTL